MQHGALERKALEAANDSIIDDVEAQFILDLIDAFERLGERAAAITPTVLAALGPGALSALGATAVEAARPYLETAFTSAQAESARRALHVVSASSGAKLSELTKPLVQAQVELDHRRRLEALLPELGKQTTDAIATAVKKAIESGWGPYEAKKEIQRLVAGAGMYPGVADAEGDEKATKYRAMVIARTEVAWARNTATTRYFDAAPDVAGLYVVDGPECGWAYHDDDQKANGIHVTFAMARDYPIAHPNCRRSFGPVFAEGKWLQYFIELKYNPAQARGSDGRWSGGFHHGPTPANLIQGPLQSELLPSGGTHHPDRHNPAGGTQEAPKEPKAPRAPKERIVDKVTISKFAEIPSSHKMDIRDAIRSVDKVLPGMKVQKHERVEVSDIKDSDQKATMDYFGFTAAGLYYGGNSSKRIGMDASKANKRTNDRQLVVAHELGHWTDQVIGQRNAEAGGTDRNLAHELFDTDTIHPSHPSYGVFKAVQDTPSFKSWQHDQAFGSAAVKKHASYLTDPKEVFARAFSQYVAERSGNGFLKAAVYAPERSSTHWKAKEFEPIGKAFDKMFADLGWRE